MRLRGGLLLCLVFGFVGARGVSAQSAPGSFVPGTCAFTPATGYFLGKNLTCGMLTVPENWAAPDGRQIELAVAVFRTPSANRRPDPIVFLQGGPGGAIVRDLGPYISSQDATVFMGNHDLILIDQRGTGASKPALTCPEVDAALAKLQRQNPSPQQQLAVEARGLQACRDRLTARGIDLSQYNTVSDAHDIAALRTALGLPEMNLYGVSYGTRVALAVMQYFPTGIRSVVLDSIVTPQYNLFSDAITAEGRAFKQLFTGCAQAPKCHAQYPHLQRTFTRLLTRLNAHPLHLKVKAAGAKKSAPVSFSGDDFAELVRSVMYVTPLIPALPKLITAVARGMHRGLQKAYNQATVPADAEALGTYESVICSEDARTATAAAIDAAVLSLPKALRPNSAAFHKGSVSLCKVWDVAPASQVSQAVPMNTPALLLEGQYDPITPPANLATTQAFLPHSFGFAFPNSGHGVYLTSACAQTVIFLFYDNPLTEPNGACVSRLKSPFP